MTERIENSLAVVEEIVSQIITDVAEDTTTEHLDSCKPVVEEDGMGQFPERSCQNHKQCRGHDKSIAVHGQVVVNSVEEEVQAQTNSVVRKPARREEISDCCKNGIRGSKIHTRRHGTGSGA